MNLNRSLLVFAGATLSLVLPGCGGAGDAPPPPVVVQVDGTLNIDAKPFGPAALVFEHASDPDAPILEATVDENGKFTMIRYPGGSNAPSGQFKVSVTEDPGAMSLEGIPTVEPSTVDITVPEGQETPLSLIVDVKASGDGVMMGGPSLDEGNGAGLGVGP